MKHHRPTAQRKRRPTDEARAPAEAHEVAPAPSVALLRDAGAPEAQRAAAIAGMQRAAGNAAVERALAQRMGAPAERELATIEGVEADPGELLLRAGTSTVVNAPNGLGTIGGFAAGMGFTAGLTRIKHSQAFQAPAFETRVVTESRRRGPVYFATVEPTSSEDAVHESYYAGPGDHLNTARPTTQEAGHTYTRYIRISAELSDLIRWGEEEHLSDALRAYQITYKLVADRINRLATRRFGPASTPERAAARARAILRRRLPRALGIESTGWAAMLDQLLSLSRTRDLKGWHVLDPGIDRVSGDRMIAVASTNYSSTRIGIVSSRELIKYPR